MILLIDNYDSFTYNLAQYLGELGAEVCVFRNERHFCANNPVRCLSALPQASLLSQGLLAKVHSLRRSHQLDRDDPFDVVQNFDQL